MRILGLSLIVLLSMAAAPRHDGLTVATSPTGTLFGVVTDSSNSDPLPGVNVFITYPNLGAATDIEGKYTIVNIPAGTYTVRFTFIGFKAIEKEVQIKDGQRMELNVALEEDFAGLEEIVVTGVASLSAKRLAGARHHQFNTENYAHIEENTFKKAQDDPLSTFSIDVDAASYSNVRRFIRQGTEPPIDAVRIEEMINYFVYEYPEPEGKHPFSIITEVGPSPWNAAHQLVHIGLQGKRLQEDELPHFGDDQLFRLRVSRT